MPRIPASVEKLYTSSAALLRFGAEGTLATDVLAAAVARRPRGRWPATCTCAAAATRASTPRAAGGSPTT